MVQFENNGAADKQRPYSKQTIIVGASLATAQTVPLPQLGRPGAGHPKANGANPSNLTHAANLVLTFALHLAYNASKTSGNRHCQQLKTRNPKHPSTPIHPSRA